MSDAQEWSVGRILAWCEGYLADHGSADARLDAQQLVGEACGLSRLELYTSFDRPLSEGERAWLREAIVRRAAGEPIQHIVGRAPFRHIELICDARALIPRPETELMSDIADELLASSGPAASPVSAGSDPDPDSTDPTDAAPAPLRVLDLCCGTGAIGLAYAAEHPGAVVTCTDVSADALALARRNVEALKLGARVRLRQGDLFDALSTVAGDDDLDAAAAGPFDLVLTNPPYVPEPVYRTEVPAEVADHEPALALVSGTDGLDHFRRIVAAAPAHMKPGAWLVCELHETTLDEACSIGREGGFADVHFREDLTGRPRFFVGRIDPAGASVADAAEPGTSAADPASGTVASAADPDAPATADGPSLTDAARV